MCMKKAFTIIIFIALIGIFYKTDCNAQEDGNNIEIAAKANLYHGFGKGHLLLGDTTTARTCRLVEIGGWSTLGVGIAGLAGSKIVYDFLVSSVGKVTTVDFYVFGGIAVTGLGTIIASRIISHNRMLKPTFGVCKIQSTPITTAGLSIQL